MHRFLELAPVNWKVTRELAEVQQILAANPYRELTLLELARCGRNPAGVKDADWSDGYAFSGGCTTKFES